MNEKRSDGPDNPTLQDIQLPDVKHRDSVVTQRNVIHNYHFDVVDQIEKQHEEKTRWSIVQRASRLSRNALGRPPIPTWSPSIHDDRIKVLSKKTGRTREEIITAAIGLYELALTAQEHHKKFGVVEPDQQLITEVGSL